MAVHGAAASCSRLDEGKTQATDHCRLEVLQITLDHRADGNKMEEYHPKWRESNFRGHYLTGRALDHMAHHRSLEGLQFLLQYFRAWTLHPSWSYHTILQAAECAEALDAVELLGHHLQYPIL